MNKRGLLLKLIVIAAVLIFGYIWFQNIFGGEEELICVPATCCHPTTCIQKGQEQDCAAVSCTMECAPGTLDCNQARCEAINGKCEVVLNN